MSYVIGVDLGTSAVKTVLVDRSGTVVAEHSESYPLSQPKPGYSEQRPEDWVDKTVLSLRQLMKGNNINPSEVEGLSFSGQMHGLVLVDGEGAVLRPAILWNDTRTTAQCRRIEETLQEKLLGIARNRALEGFTLPKILWVQEFEPELLERAALFLLPKDYVRFRLTGQYAMDYPMQPERCCWTWPGNPGAPTFWMLSSCRTPYARRWSNPSTNAVPCSPRLPSKPLCCRRRRCLPAADNACGAIGAGILEEGQTMCSIGTSGVVLSYEERREVDFEGRSISLTIARKMLIISWGNPGSGIQPDLVQGYLCSGCFL